MSYFRRIPLLVVVFIIVAVSSVVSVAQVPPADAVPALPHKEGVVLLSPEEALERDAMSYASDYGVELPEAIRRLQLQDIVGKLNAKLVAKEQNTFAGLWIQHTPQYRIVVRFTHGGEETLRSYVQGGPLADIVELRTADVTLAALKVAQEQAVGRVSALGITAEAGIDLPENKVELYVIEAARLEAALRETKVQLPDNVEIIEVDELIRDDIGVSEGLELSPSNSVLANNIYGGLPLTKLNGAAHATSGFAVTDGQYPPCIGIATAGHAEDELKYNGVELDFAHENMSPSYDVQWHYSNQFTVKPWFFDGSTLRVVLGTKGRDEQDKGDYVCKYGVKTGYTCGTIEKTNYTAYGASTWILVKASNGDLSKRGDSGGPWFNGNTAYGIHKGSSGTNDAYYMAINYVSGINVSVMIDD